MWLFVLLLGLAGSVGALEKIECHKCNDGECQIAMLDCKPGVSCVCNNDAGYFATALECQGDCPTSTVCYGCVNEQCSPAFYDCPFGQTCTCDILSNGLHPFSSRNACRASGQCNKKIQCFKCVNGDCNQVEQVCTPAFECKCDNGLGYFAEFSSCASNCPTPVVCHGCQNGDCSSKTTDCPFGEDCPCSDNAAPFIYASDALCTAECPAPRTCYECPANSQDGSCTSKTVNLKPAQSCGDEGLFASEADCLLLCQRNINCYVCNPSRRACVKIVHTVRNGITCASLGLHFSPITCSPVCKSNCYTCSVAGGCNQIASVCGSGQCSCPNPLYDTEAQCSPVCPVTKTCYECKDDGTCPSKPAQLLPTITCESQSYFSSEDGCLDSCVTPTDCYRCVKHDCVLKVYNLSRGQTCADFNAHPDTATCRQTCLPEPTLGPRDHHKIIDGHYGYSHNLHGSYSYGSHTGRLFNIGEKFGPHGAGVNSHHIVAENFRTKDARQQKFRHCNFPVSEGWGHESIPSYYYDPFRKWCRIFFYKGNGGNPNRFVSLPACQLTCRDQLARPKVPFYKKFEHNGKVIRPTTTTKSPK